MIQSATVSLLALLLASGLALAQPATDAPKAEPPKTEAPAAEPPKTEAPKTEAPKSETARPEYTPEVVAGRRILFTTRSEVAPCVS